MDQPTNQHRQVQITLKFTRQINLGNINIYPGDEMVTIRVQLQSKIKTKYILLKIPYI